MLNKFNLKYSLFGDKAILIEWPHLIDESILGDILFFKENIQHHFNSIEMVSAYNSLTLIFSSPIDFQLIEGKLKEIYKSKNKTIQTKKKLWKIPVCYDKNFGIDLNVFSKENKLSVNEIIKLHTSAIYTVYCIGFLPGFMYLGGLNKKLFHARRKEPRLKIPKGSIGIGGKQTGLYPKESPGGWNIIGNSPINTFNSKANNPCKISVGDKVQFYKVSKARHELIGIQVKADIFILESEVLND